MTDRKFPPPPRHIPDCYVYTLLCQGHGGEGYVKFGLSRRIGARLQALKRGVPFEEFKIAVVQCFNVSEMKSVERALHERFAHRRTKGEWFLFDFAAPSDKSEYNEGCRAVFRENMRDQEARWVKIDFKAVREHEERLRKEREERERRFILSVCANDGFDAMPLEAKLDALAAGAGPLKIIL